MNILTVPKRISEVCNESKIHIHEGKSAGNKTVTQISKHLQKVHKDEEKIPKGNEKNRLLSELKVAGNAAFNQTRSVNKGQLIVTGRSRK